MKSGVYKITCGKRFYIGSTNDFDRRWYDHKAKLKCGRHSNQFMQNLWNKTRGHGFKFEVLIGCAPEQRLKFEQELIDFHWGDKNFLNLNPSAYCQFHSAATKKKISDTCKRRQINKGQTWTRGTGNGRAKAITVVFTDGTTKHYDYITLLADELGVNQATVGRWLNGIRNPSKKFKIKEITRGHL